MVSLIRQLVTVVEERVVLFLCLDEAGDNLFNGCNSRGLLDLLKGILNDFHVTQVLVHQPLLLPIRCHDLRQTQFQDGQRVLELAVLRLLLRRGCRLVVVNLVFFFFLVKFLLVAFDLCLEVVLVLFVLGSEGNGLVDLLLGKTLAEQGCTVLLLRLLVHLLRFVRQPLSLSALVHDLLPEHVDFTLELFVGGLGLVEAELLVLDGVALAVQADLVKLFVHMLRPDLVDVLLPLQQLVVDLLDLVLQDLKLALFVLKLLRIDVHLFLQARSFALVDGVVSAAH